MVNEGIPIIKRIAKVVFPLEASAKINKINIPASTEIIQNYFKRIQKTLHFFGKQQAARIYTSVFATFKLYKL